MLIVSLLIRCTMVVCLTLLASFFLPSVPTACVLSIKKKFFHQFFFVIRKYGSTFYNFYYRDCYVCFALYWHYGKTEISVFTFSFHSI